MNEAALFVKGIFLKIPGYFAVLDAIKRLLREPLVNWVGGHVDFRCKRKSDAVVPGAKRLYFLVRPRFLPAEIIGRKAHYCYFIFKLLVQFL